MVSENIEIAAKEQSLKENLSQVMKEKDHLEQELSERVDQLKKENLR